MEIKSFDWISSDILRERSTELGISKLEKIPTKKLLINGSFYAALLLFIKIVVLIFIATYSGNLNSRINSLKLDSKKSDELKESINSIKREITKKESLNKNIASSIFKQKSLIALLNEISNNSPKALSLNEITLKENKLTIKGFTPEPSAVSKTNSFILALNQSQLLVKNSFQLDEAIGKEIIFAATKSKESKIGVITFIISGNIKTFYDDISVNYLEKIGAKGLSNRYKLLVEEKYKR
tara:strand:- start:301 stop:1017 length:717 start_codon:yes stop_codon:yes gene_type:complete